jgi:hypothetical protein
MEESEAKTQLLGFDPRSVPPASSVSVKLSEVRLEQGRRFGDG